MWARARTRRENGFEKKNENYSTWRNNPHSMCMHIVHVCLHNRQQQKENAIVIFKEEMKSRNKVRYAAKPAKMTIMKLKSMTSRIFITLNQIAHLLSVQSKLQIKWDCHIFNILIGTIMLSLLSPRYNIRMGLSVICSSLKTIWLSMHISQVEKISAFSIIKIHSIKHTFRNEDHPEHPIPGGITSWVWNDSIGALFNVSQ